MFKITIDPQEVYDEERNEFISVDGCTLELEHSLVALSKWEAEWCKPFFNDTEKTMAETIDYIRCMTLNEVDPSVYLFITSHHIEQVREYIEKPMTAAWFSNTEKGGRSGKTVTNELVYCWMVQLQIPFECQYWHFNRLMTLIKVVNEENKDPKKMNKNEIMRQQAEINAARRRAMKTKG